MTRLSPARLFAALALAYSEARGAILLPSHIASSMVLQSGTPVPIWGLDAPGASVTAVFGGKALPPVTCDSTGRFDVVLPASPVSGAPTTLQLSSSSGSAAVTLSDIVVGALWVCSGQSNMGLSIANVAEVQEVLAASSALGPLLRVFQVALLDEYANATSPQSNLTASIPWSRASPASVPGMSALCYLTAAKAVAARGEPVGIMANAWGGVAIQVYMSPQSLAKCGGAAAPPPPGPLERIAAAEAPGASRSDVAHGMVARAEVALARSQGYGSTFPTNASCLFFSMLYPLFSVPVSALLWYQGESNAGDPLGYQCLQREMIADWRERWVAAGSSPTVPFLFVQLSAWPIHSEMYGQPFLLPIFRVAVEKTLTDLPNVGMVVAADIADPSGAYHPIHPPWKAELARRAWLWADNAVFGNSSSPTSGPRPVSAVFDAWDATWGDSWHFGSGGNSYVCESATWTCGGVRVTFDRPVGMRPFYNVGPTSATELMYGFVQGAPSGFELWQSDNATAWTQRAPITAISSDGRTVYLNTTWIGPVSKTPTLLKYGWQDYPDAMPLQSADGFALPVGPFNMTLTF